MSRISTSALALSTLMALAFQGCAILEYHEYSAPELGPEHRPANGNGVTIQAGEKVITITSQNSGYRFAFVGPYPVPIFPIWHTVKHSPHLIVTLSAREQPKMLQSTQTTDRKPDQNSPKQGLIAIHPMQITLESHGTVLSPIGFNCFNQEPSPPSAVQSASEHSSCHDKGNPGTQSELLTEDREIPFAGAGYVSLTYDRASSPDEPFTLHVYGLTLNGHPVEVPSFHFQKGSGWFLYALP